MAGRSATKPSRSDEVLDADEQERIANQIRQQLDSLAPKRPIKPNRSEPDPDASLHHSSAVSSHNIPELLKFQSFQSESHAVFSDEGPKDVPDEFIETRYYQELTSIDKQHHTTGSGFIRVERVEGYDLIFQNTQMMNGGETKVPECKSNPATNDWIPNINAHQGLAYKLIDEVLDFTGTSASLGKGSLSDIHHGIITAPLLFAMEEFPQLRAVTEKGFDNPANVDLALDYLGKSRGIQRTRELALEHARIAA